jgi:hypothetical protein
MTPDPALLEIISGSLRSDLRPVRPLPATWAMIAALFAFFAAVSLFGAIWLSFAGFNRLSNTAVAAIFLSLAVLALLAAAAAASAMVPGSSRWFHPAAVPVAACLVMAGVFSFVFPDHHMGRFVHDGIVCLKAGILWAAPAAVGAWVILLRGFAVDRGAAGIALGTFAGLAGVAVLELHCPNFHLPHVIVWHLAVLPIAALVGQALLYSTRKS